MIFKNYDLYLRMVHLHRTITELISVIYILTVFTTLFKLLPEWSEIVSSANMILFKSLDAEII